MTQQNENEIRDFVIRAGFGCWVEDGGVVIACFGKMNGRRTYAEAKVATMNQARSVVHELQVAGR